MEILLDDDAEVDKGYAQHLISNVIANISEPDDDDGKDHELAHAGSGEMKTDKSTDLRKEKVRGFTLDEIMGDFEVDTLGNFIIIRGPHGSTDLYDKLGRRVNRRGYLSDRFGNIINDRGEIVFKAVELDEDDEIPAPFGFERRKRLLARLKDQNDYVVDPAEVPPVFDDARH